jgi:hypothetical protein
MNNSTPGGIDMTVSQRRQSIGWAAHWGDRSAFSGLELLLLEPGVADSSLIVVSSTQSYRLTYTLNWDSRWSIRSARTAVTGAAGEAELILSHDGNGLWQNSRGVNLDELTGCDFIDIWPTPFTNTFPIRRLDLSIGERREIRVAYVEAPELSLTAVTQAYTRISDRVYRFESVGDGFQSDIEVDEAGLVVEYPGLFRRIC